MNSINTSQPNSTATSRKSSRKSHDRFPISSSTAASIPSAMSHRTVGARARAIGAPHRARLARPRAAPPGPGPADVRRGAQEARRAMPA
jgi:hypothetical protein